MKKWSWLVVVLVSASVDAATLVLHNGGSSLHTTGDNIDEADHDGLWTNVVEISDLLIFAQSGATSQDVNSLSDSLGIDSDGSGDDSDKIEGDESLTLAFSKDVQITQFDFNHFDSNETVIISFEDQFDLSLDWSNLTHKGSDYLNTNITVSAESRITFSVASSNDVIGIEGITLNVVGGSGDLYLSMKTSNDWMTIEADFDGTATTNYVLQSSTNLTSNVWSSVTGTFNADTNWTFNATNAFEFFRAVEQ